MTTIYIDITENADMDYAVMVAGHREAKKIIFIGESAVGKRAAENLRIEHEQLPAGTKIPSGQPRLFAGKLTFAY